MVFLNYPEWSGHCRLLFFKWNFLLLWKIPLTSTGVSLKKLSPHGPGFVGWSSRNISSSGVHFVSCECDVLDTRAVKVHHQEFVFKSKCRVQILKASAGTMALNLSLVTWFVPSLWIHSVRVYCCVIFCFLLVLLCSFMVLISSFSFICNSRYCF